MSQLILADILMLSVGAMLYLMVRTLPRLDEKEIKAEKQPSLIDRWLASGIPGKLDALVNSSLGKLFRKLKVMLLRIDNYLTEKLKKINTDNGSAPVNPKIDFKEITGEENGKAR